MKNVREVIINQFLRGIKPYAIFKSLKQGGIKCDFVYKTIKRFKETGSTENRPKSGRPRTARTKSNIKIVREQIRRKRCRSVRKIAASLKISKSSAHLLLKKDVGLKPYKKQKIHGVSISSKDKRAERVSSIQAWHGGDEFVFSDEKLFVLQQSHNAQNDRVWAVSLEDVPESELFVPRYQSALSIMVWGGFCKRGKLPLVFIEKGVKVNAVYYKEHVLKSVVLPACKHLFGDDYYCFQQDGAPSHTAKICQDWCEENLADFLRKDEWPPSSPDLNPMDFFAWGYITAKLNDYKIRNLGQLRKTLQKIWEEMPMNHVRAACNSFEKRLGLVKKGKGGVINKNLL